MNFYQKKRWLFGGLLLACAIVLGCVFTLTEKNEIQSTTDDTNSVARKAGVVASLEAAESDSIEQAVSANLQVAKTETVVVEAKTKQQETQPKVLTKTQKQWKNKVMAVVDESLSVRQKATTDAQIVGKMYPTSVAQVVKKGKNWTKIKSGDVKGYVNNEYLVFGEDAYANAKKVCKTYATVQVNGLRVRSKADEDASVVTTADEGSKLELDTDAKKAKGWIAVITEKGSGYVSRDYVDVALDTGKAVSIEEELAAQKAKEEAEAKELRDALQKADSQSASTQQAASTQSQEQSTVTTTQNEATPATVDDETLLAAIIMCEAGNEPYTGQVAVGAVVCNRVRSGSYPNTISGVIYQRNQFSPAGNGRLATALATGNIFQSCRQAAAEALAGSDPTGGAHSFHRVNGDAGLVIGNHVFF